MRPSRLEHYLYIPNSFTNTSFALRMAAGDVWLALSVPVCRSSDYISIRGERGLRQSSPERVRDAAWSVAAPLYISDKF